MEHLIVLVFIGGIFCSYDESDPTDMYVKQEEEAILTCGFEDARLRWQYYNGSVWRILANVDSVIDDTKYKTTKNPSTGLYYRLHIMNSVASDERLYRCQSGTKLFFFHLNLLVPTTNISISNMVHNRLMGTEGHDLHVVCSANGKPAPVVTIVMDGTVLENATKSAQYIFSKIKRDRDRKNLECQATNNPTETRLAKTVEIYLNLKPIQPTFSPQHISTDENTPLVVSCTSEGSRPAAVFLWKIGETNVTSSSLITQSSQQADETYHVTSQLQYSVNRSGNGQQITCTAVNVAGDSGTIRVLNVAYPPDIRVSNITYNQNDVSRTVTCTAVGNPKQYSYSKWIHKSENGEVIRELDGGQNGVLTLPSETVSNRYQDSGEYVCTVSNGIKNKDGNLHQRGSGYVVVHANPVFTRNNTIIQYGEIGQTIDLNVYVYSIPKYTTIQWYKGNTPISPSGRYTVSDTATIVYDAFHGEDVLLDGYKITLRIANLEVSDFDSYYRMLISNGVSSAVDYSVQIESTSPPSIPENFTVVSFSSDSIMVQWFPGYNFRRDQTFVIEYREQGSKNWETQMVPNKTMSNCQIYQLIGLLGGTHYELRIFAFNKFNKSLYTDPPEEIGTLPPRDLPSSSQCRIGAVAGGLTALICVLIVIIAYFLVMIKRGNLLLRSRLKNRSKDNNDKLGIKDSPNTYEEIGNRRGLNSDKTQGETYEMLGSKDVPNTYDMIEEKKGLRAEYSNLKV